MTTSAPNTMPATAIAVIGMAGRFPGARSVAEFWRNLRADSESIVTLSDEDLSAAGVSDEALASRNYVKRAALMDGIEEFDAEFFGFTPQAARMMDPQHRLFLQSAWQAIEDAGLDPGAIEGSMGVFGTSSTSGYLLHNLISHVDANRVIGQGASFDMVSLSLQNDKDHLATRVAHQLNLRGPALAVQTACSSSLLAVHLACASILNGECEMALAGGSSIRVPHHVGYWHEPGSMVSPSGHCRPFDARSDGTIFGSGVGVVLLKPLQDALEDGDRIRAVIRGSAVNNDGSTKMNYAAPNAAGQAEAIAEAHAVAEVDASTISYVESHGTGTPLGDPIEIEGLRQAFELSEDVRRWPCVVGSVKSNIGHLEVASGIASLIKTILCLENRGIPGTLHYTSPNPELHLERGPFEVRSGYQPWDTDGVRRAGVSSFGVGGTNVHMVLEEAPAGPVGSPATGPQVLTMSARSAESLAEGRRALAAELSANDDLDLGDVACTLARRRPEQFRLVAVARDRATAAAMLAAADDDTINDTVFVGESVAGTDRVVLLFPGQGAQHVGMARGLYDTEPVFTEYFDRAAAGFAEELGIDLRAEIFDGTARNLERTDRAQPALFTVEYALAKTLESYGVRPAALAGHSIGEYAAATYAGVFDLETAVKAVSVRARLMHAAPRGVMVAVALSPEDIAEHLGDDVDLAAVNDPGGCVVAGSEQGIAAFTTRLADRGVAARRVRTSHAFHSRLMDPVVPEFTGALSRMSLREPHIPLLSNVSGTWLSPGEATKPATWSRQIRATVRFADELATVLADADRVVVEVGPGGTLTSSAARHPRWGSRHRAVRLMRHQAQNRDDHDTFLLGLGQLWAAGVDVDLPARRTTSARRRLVSLPGYPFARQRHWVEYNSAARTGHTGSGAAGQPAHNGHAAVTQTGGRSPIETTLQRIWAQCLGIPSIDRTANFFELGGDSLIAISVAMTAGNEGLDLTPQDLYENQTVAALAKRLAARYAEGGLTRQSVSDTTHPPLPPNVLEFTEHGLSDSGSWRIPLILRLRPDVSTDDIAAVLTALTGHHDGLRLRLVRRADSWEQHIDEPGEFTTLAQATLPDGVAAGQERAAVLTILDQQITGVDGAAPMLLAVHVTGGPGGSCFLALGVHGIVGDPSSRDILLTDLFTAFGQRLAGEPIQLQSAGPSWREWSQLSSALATHPAVIDSREFWTDAATSPTLRIAGPASGPPARADLATLSTALTVAETTEIDDARRRLKAPIDDLLLAALGRAVAATAGEGVLAVDLAGSCRSVLRPEVDPRRTVGLFTAVYPVPLTCAGDHGAQVRDQLAAVHERLAAVPHYGIGYGLLRHLYGPTARRLSGVAPADIHLAYAGAIPDLPPDSPTAESGATPIQFDTDTALPVREATAGLGHAIELRVYRSAGVLHLDWWYDTRRVEPDRIAALADAFSSTLASLAREAIVEDEMETASDELELIDLSSPDLPTPDLELGEANARP